MLSAVFLCALYVLGGFFALPAIVKWQVEKQVRAQLGHSISIGDIRFNPLLFRFEVDELTFSDPDGQSLLGFKHLLVDFELRSLIDRAWTFAEARLEAPLLHFALDKNGRHNFAPLLERLPESEPDQEDAGLPRFIVQRLAVTDGRFDFSDQLHDEPLVARLEPLSIEIDNLSSLPEQAGSYRLSARTAVDETLESSGELALNPIATKGRLTLSGLQLATLARSVPRLLAIEPPAGKIDLGASFDLAVDAGGVLAGVVQELDFDIAGLSLSAAGADSPLLALETLSLKQGRVDLAAREARLATFRLAKGSVAVTFDEDGKLNWQKLLRAAVTEPEEKAARAASEASTEVDGESEVATANGPEKAPEKTTTEQETSSLAAAKMVAAPETASAAIPGETTAATAEETTAVAADAAEAVTPGAWRVLIDSAEISELAFGYAEPAQALAIDVAALAFATSPSIDLTVAGTRIELAQPKLALSGTRLKSGANSLELPEGSVAAEKIGMLIADAGFDLTIDKAETSLDGLKAQSGADGADLGKLAMVSEKLSLAQSATGLELTIDRPQTSLDGLKARSAADGVDLGKLAIASETLSLAQSAGALHIDVAAAQVSMAGLAAHQGADRIKWQDASLDVRAIGATLAGSSASPAATGLKLSFADVALKLKALGAVAQGAKSEVARIAAASLGAKSLVLALPGGPLDVTGDGLSVALSEAVFHSPADVTTEMVRFARANISGGVLRLKDRMLSVDKLVVADGKAQTWLDAEGKFNGLIVTRGAAEAAVDAAAAAEGDATAAEVAWRVAVKSVEVDNYALGFEDRSGGPPLALGLEAIRARVAGFATGVSTPMQVELKASVASGGEIEAKGSVRADNGSSDLQLKLAGIALAPVQPYLSEFAELTLASGTLSTGGRLRYGDPAADAKLVYKGSFAVDKLQIDEIEPKRPFVTWQTLATDDLLLNVEPNRLDIGELRLVAPDGRLIIAEDQSMNLTDVLKKPKGGESAAAADETVGEKVAAGAAEAAATADDGAMVDDPFPVSIARIRISKGALEFADLSLRPQFGTRMHDLKGVITGLGTDPARSAKVQLDANVDKYGSAKIRGQISVFRPAKLTDIEMTFRNLTMSSLSPYVVKFAGRRITGGQLALDLQYKVKDSKLRGENKIVLKQVKLGEQVDTPGAADLPLDLAIAILSDSKGVIDIGLPVSGDLNDPEFSYAAVVGKAFGNLIGGIITAPFRALGALFGAGSDAKLDSIDFEPGRAVLAPPEREKLAAVAGAMKERKTLTLVVAPAQSAEVDTPALKSLAVRTAIVARMGLELTPGDDPGPVDAADPRAQVAIEALFSERYAPEVLALVKQRAGAAAPAGKSSAGKSAAGPPPAFYQTLLERMIKEQPVSDEVLAQLATRRAEAIVAEVSGADGVAAKRVQLGKARPASAASDKAVTLQLELEVAK
ncbi:DUF748 domain-containing protein [Accumulibacter sp.]|uniref:DUF748 domain-containing protein n=1 Tax=Accumulibacter sp. TaxID=2053492 RepID=UPI002C88E302|nr:DUF748 domain-containing protein [Accumulibacter sp.]HRF06820.1 DUF748 domain-containing protein [Accumulibacter sp.]